MNIQTPNEEQQQNLRKLAEYALGGDLNARFDMRHFADYDSLSSLDEALAAKDCGAVGCMVGHGPYAGIPKRYGETWTEYAERAFGAHKRLLFAHLFSGAWVLYDNTPEGAGRRILGVLEQIEQGALTEAYLVEHTPFPLYEYP